MYLAYLYDVDMRDPFVATGLREQYDILMCALLGRAAVGGRQPGRRDRGFYATAVTDPRANSVNESARSCSIVSTPACGELPVTAVVCQISTFVSFEEFITTEITSNPNEPHCGARKQCSKSPHRKPS